MPEPKTITIPHAVRDAEAAVLGACIVNSTVLRDLELEVDDFGMAKHRVVFAALRNLEAAQRPIDPMTVELQLEREGKLEALAELGAVNPAASAVAFLGALVLAPATIENAHEYARTVRDEHTKRRVMVAASNLVQVAGDGAVSGQELLAIAATSFGAIDGVTAEQATGIGELATKRFADIERLAQERLAGGAALTGAPTGVRELDAKIGGFQFGIVNLIAGRPGMGKSSAALACADASSEAGLGVHAFILEDSWHAYTDRQLARRSGVPAIKIRQASMSSDEVVRLYREMVALKKRTNWIVDHRGALTAQEVVRAMRRRQDKNGTRVAQLDYLQLLKPRDPRMKDHEHLGDCMQTLSDSAKVDDVAWVVMSQFNRDLEKRVDKRPTLADLRGSGEIEEKCKIAVGIYRGAAYGGKPKRDIDWECECLEAVRGCAHAPSLEQWEQQVQLLVLKGGNGPTGTVLANWDGPTTRIW